MKYVKWIFVVLFISSLTSFVEKDKPTSGLSVGDIAPNFKIRAISDEQQLELDSFKGKYVLLSFWASYDAQSRIQNVSMNNALQNLPQSVKLVSISFDEYKSVFDETIRRDGIQLDDCYLEIKGETSFIFKSYGLNRGFRNYLLDANGVIVAKNIAASELSSYIN